MIPTFCPQCGTVLHAIPRRDEGEWSISCASCAALIEPTLISHFQILTLLGTGGFGSVYLASDMHSDQIVALKVLSKKLFGSPHARGIFREAHAVAGLAHPNIAKIYEVGEEEEFAFVAREYISGESLRSKINTGPLSGQEALDIATQLSRALEALHSQGIIHRDIKPENVLIDSTGNVKLIDFALATTNKEEDEGLGEERTIVGTLAYMSPEQMSGAVDPRADIFSLGIVFYEMLTGYHPFRGATTEGSLFYMLEAGPLPLAEFSPAIPKRIQRIVNKTLRKKREDRYQTATELLTDLTDATRKLSVKHTRGKLGRREMPKEKDKDSQVDDSVYKEAAIPQDRRTSLPRWISDLLQLATLVTVLGIVWQGGNKLGRVDTTLEQHTKEIEKVSAKIDKQSEDINSIKVTLGEIKKDLENLRDRKVVGVGKSESPMSTERIAARGSGSTRTHARPKSQFGRREFRSIQRMPGNMGRDLVSGGWHYVTGKRGADDSQRF
jgi:serine/threonine protein kinase